MKKIRVGILCGGKSAEHEISLLSARNIIHALDKNTYEVIVIGIDKKGHWLPQDTTQALLAESVTTSSSYRQIAYSLEDASLHLQKEGAEMPIDVIFPVLHGPYGEDGSMQGLLKLANIPFVGAGILGSAMSMDKDVMKRLLREAGIPVVNFLVFHDFQKKEIVFEEVCKKIGLPLFVKPANLGSSVGISKVHTQDEFEKALDTAFLYDTKILLEEAISGRKIECSVLGNDELIASLPGEVIPQQEFYSYDAKYLDPEGALFAVPAKLDATTTQKIQDLAIQTAKTLCVEGMARVDFFLKPDGTVMVNEINTIPGFTAISMYPKMWEASGISYADLLDRLIQLAIERFEKEKKLQTSR